MKKRQKLVSATPDSKLQTPNSVRCPAKINLDLHVGPPRADGFHPVNTWMVTVGLFDTIDFAPADDIRLTCSDPTIPADARNLVWRAAAALRPAGGPGVAMRLTKSIPAGGGLGGGSSNAAATLVALNDFWGLRHSRQRLSEIAAALGSDVPFFLNGPSSVCTGRGEIVTPVPPPACGWALLILPGIAMPTPAVYRRLDELRAGAAGDVASVDPQRPPAANAAALLSRLVNDLESPAFDLSPELARIRTVAEDRLNRPVRMSGSGSTLFTLYDDESQAALGSELMSDLWLSVRVEVGVKSGCREPLRLRSSSFWPPKQSFASESAIGNVFQSQNVPRGTFS